MADGLSARSANSPDVRYKLRTRARYEVANNSYAKGIVLTLANDCIGTGPRLQLLGDDTEANGSIEEAWEEWSAAICLSDKLRTMRQAVAEDGETFGLMTTNPALPTEVQLDLRLIEADQITTPNFDPLHLFDPLASDGIIFDEAGNPVEYHVLRQHPGDTSAFGHAFGEYDVVPARFMIHWFRRDRPGQVRGVPEITPALHLFAQLRRYTLAVLAAAETAADFAAVLYSELPPDTETLDTDPFDSVEIERRMMTTLPAGWKMAQFKAEQPATTYEMFKREILNEIARCLNMPYNVAAGNSSGYNYSSGRLDHQTYYKSIGVDQSVIAYTVLDRLFLAWLDELSLKRELPKGGPYRLGGWPHLWFWPGLEHVDPVKEAQAQQIRLANGTTTRAIECARDGRDWEDVTRQQAKEIALDKELGIARNEMPGVTPAVDPSEEGAAETPTSPATNPARPGPGRNDA